MRSHAFLLLLFAAFSSCLASRSDSSARISKLQSLQRDGGVVPLNSALFDEFTATPRTYGFVVLLTALGREFNCIPCRKFDPEYHLVASSWKKKNEKNEERALFFGKLDFKDGQEIYARLKLTTAPNILYYPPTSGPYARSNPDPVRYDLNKGFEAESLAEFLAPLVGTEVPVKRPLNYTLIASVAFLFAGVLASFKIMYPKVMKVVQSRNTWMFATLVTVFMMCSGHMWNQIRKPPYVAGNRGKIQYIASGYQNQYGIESQIIAVLYAGCALSVVVLTVAAPKIADGAKQRIVVYAAMGTFIFLFSLINSLFRTKQPSYPIRLFL
ncbi:uncharacterized protein VTP21DRAFT_11269 [Calcarisporiella thermophila]|uniref:uncharacterized protein n=1 Tax=Calcarisporiella thermophila TaxID=911321 RepID=UPI003742DB79